MARTFQYVKIWQVYLNFTVCPEDAKAEKKKVGAMIMMSSDIMLFPYSQAQDIGLVERIRTFSSETLI